MARNVQTDPRTLDPQFYRNQGLISYLGVPLLMKGEVLGVLVFLTREEHRFSNEEIQFLSILAGQAAMAIHNSQLYEQTKKQAVSLARANIDLKRKEEIQELLKELSQDITTLDIDSLFKKLTDKVREFFKVDVSDVRILSQGNREILGVSGIDEQRIRLGSMGVGRGGSGWVVKNRRPLVVPDIDEAKNLPIGQTIRRIGIRGYLGVPLFSRHGEVIGVLRALTYQRRDFLPEEIDLLQQMANGAAIALENARLLEQTKNQALELENANKVKDEFLGFVSHELRTPVNAVMGYAALLQNKTFGEINSEQERALRKVIGNSRELLNMINSLLEATRIEADAVKTEITELDLGDFLQELRADYDVPLNKELTLMWQYPSGLPKMRTDGEKLRHILQNLVNNAIKYTDKGHVTVSARHLADLGRVEFQVADTGVGIPEEALPSIFEMFRQVNGSPTRSSGGVGLGLHIVRKFTEFLGGEIKVRSEVSKGSTFTVTLPCQFWRPVDQEPRTLH